MIIARPDQHLQVRGASLILDRNPRCCGRRPSADALFDSLADRRAPSTIACLLTGMGHDGAAGLAAFRAAVGELLLVEREQARAPVHACTRCYSLAPAPS